MSVPLCQFWNHCFPKTLPCCSQSLTFATKMHTESIPLGLINFSQFLTGGAPTAFPSNLIPAPLALLPVLAYPCCNVSLFFLCQHSGRGARFTPSSSQVPFQICIYPLSAFPFSGLRYHRDFNLFFLGHIFSSCCHSCVLSSGPSASLSVITLVTLSQITHTNTLTLLYWRGAFASLLPLISQ